jgi:hypothetical protein
MGGREWVEVRKCELLVTECKLFSGTVVGFKKKILESTSSIREK